MRPISKELVPDLNRKQRVQLATFAAEYDWKEKLYEQMTVKFPTLKRKEIKWRIQDLYGDQVGEQFSIMLWQRGKEKWPTLLPDEVLNLIRDGALSSPEDDTRSKQKLTRKPRQGKTSSFASDVVGGVKGFINDPTVQELGGIAANMLEDVVKDVLWDLACELLG